MVDFSRTSFHGFFLMVYKPTATHNWGGPSCRGFVMIHRYLGPEKPCFFIEDSYIFGPFWDHFSCRYNRSSRFRKRGRQVVGQFFVSGSLDLEKNSTNVCREKRGLQRDFFHRDHPNSYAHNDQIIQISIYLY